MLRRAPEITQADVIGQQVTVRGFGEALSEVVLLVDGDIKGTTAIGSDETWEITIPLPLGEHDIYVAPLAGASDPAKWVGPQKVTVAEKPKDEKPAPDDSGPPPPATDQPPAGAPEPRIARLRVRNACVPVGQVRHRRPRARKGRPFFAFRVTAPARLEYRLIRRAAMRGAKPATVARGTRVKRSSGIVRLALSRVRNWHPLRPGRYTLRVQAIARDGHALTRATTRFRIARRCA